MRSFKDKLLAFRDKFLSKNRRSRELESRAKIRGVNIGAWLVLEKWMVPSLFANTDAVDEWTLSAKLGPSAMSARMEQHWSTWFKWDHVARLKAAGITHVRIPIGYWAVVDLQPHEPYVKGQLPFLIKAAKWCEQAGMMVLVDLHGVPGSQNGFDNSGRQGEVEWQSSGDNIGRSKMALWQLCNALQSIPSVIAIELVNEPAGFNPRLNLDHLGQYYIEARETVRCFRNPDGSSRYMTFIHDAFQPMERWRFLAGDGDTAFDTHIYHVFAQHLDAMDERQHLKHCGTQRGWVSDLSLPTVVGEWSLATTRKDYSLTNDYKAFLKEFAKRQITAWETNMGWYFWNFRMERGYTEWDFLKLVDLGIIDLKDPTTFRAH